MVLPQRHVKMEAENTLDHHAYGFKNVLLKGPVLVTLVIVELLRTGLGEEIISICIVILRY